MKSMNMDRLAGNPRIIGLRLFICTLFLEELQSEKDRVVVHPVTNKNMLKIESHLPLETIRVYNTRGQLLKEVNTLEFSVKELTKGLYFLHIIADEVNNFKRFLIG